MRSLVSTAVLWFAACALAADRPITEDEHVRLIAALQAQGCTGGKFEFDDGAFEVDDVRCADGRTYDLKFEASR